MVPTWLGRCSHILHADFSSANVQSQEGVPRPGCEWGRPGDAAFGVQWDHMGTFCSCMVDGDTAPGEVCGFGSSCYAMQCHSLPCHAVSFCVMLCHALPCHAQCCPHATSITSCPLPSLQAIEVQQHCSERGGETLPLGLGSPESLIPPWSGSPIAQQRRTSFPSLFQSRIIGHFGNFSKGVDGRSGNRCSEEGLRVKEGWKQGALQTSCPPKSPRGASVCPEHHSHLG